MASRFEIKAVAFDPFQATQLSTRMLSEGLPMIEVRPTVLNFSEPMKTLEALVLQKRLSHDGDPVLTWMASNVVAHLDAKDNIYPRKERPENKIDGIVALIMALSRAIKPGDSVVLGADYEIMLV
jgi:phage terminase large subunit-like protein